MKLDGRIIQARSSIEIGLLLAACLCFLGGLCAITQQNAGAQQQSGVSIENIPLTTEQVVEQMVEMNLRRAQALHSYHGTRTYQVNYRSIFRTVSAEMVVGVKYLAPGTKQFTVQSSTGSKLIVDRVFKKLLEAEEDVLSKDGQRSTALNSENYESKLVGYVSSPPQSMYVLRVEPKTESKFLFRGRVWVDANDFAVARLEAEPAKNPSFWTKNSEIEQSYVKVDEFWLPERNHSISSIRFGGRAELTIEYQNYKITAADPVGSAPTHEVAESVETSRKPDRGQTPLRHTAEVGSLLSSPGGMGNENPLSIRSRMLQVLQASAIEVNHQQ